MWASFVGAIVLLGAAPAVAQQALEARAAPRKMTLAEMRVLNVDARVIVKFREGSGVRLRGGQLGATRSADLGSLSALLRTAGIAPAAIRRLHDVSEQELDTERAAAQSESGRQLADLNLYFIIDLTPGINAAEFADQLNRLAIVEIAEPQLKPTPLPVDIAPTSPNLTGNQGYKAVGPTGIGALNPKNVPGGDGKGMTVVDVEYSWQLNHEDLELPASAIVNTGNARDPFGDTNHGTAVLGEIGAEKNAYGVTGIAPRATKRVAATNTSDFGFSVARAITKAASALKRGHVIIIEQQAPVCGGACGANQVGCGPVEYYQAEYDAIAAATAKGVIVLAAAGNGNVDLDAPACGGRFNRKTRDSLAIIVGAGSSSNRSRLSFSSYGSRVDVQGWGENVTTTGYGDAFNPGDVRQRYTNSFGGTSGATPIVTGAVLAIQGALKADGLKLAKPKEMRTALVKTGTAQTNPGTGRIGPLPRIKNALARIKSNRGRTTVAER
jgi:hypothetical protein